MKALAARAEKQKALKGKSRPNWAPYVLGPNEHPYSVFLASAAPPIMMPGPMGLPMPMMAPVTDFQGNYERDSYGVRRAFEFGGFLIDGTVRGLKSKGKRIKGFLQEHGYFQKTVDDIIDNATRDPKGKRSKVYDSDGEKGWDAAEDAFDSLSVDDVKDIDTEYGPGKTGILNDDSAWSGHNVTLRPGSRSNPNQPTIDVTKPNGKGKTTKVRF